LAVAIDTAVNVTAAEFLEIGTFIAGIKVGRFFIEDAPAGSEVREGSSKESRHIGLLG